MTSELGHCKMETAVKMTLALLSPGVAVIVVASLSAGTLILDELPRMILMQKLLAVLGLLLRLVTMPLLEGMDVAMG